jgi:hypothetical protein
VRGDGGARLAAEDVVKARERTAFVIEPIVVQERIADMPPGKAIDNNVELVLGRAFRRRSVPRKDALIEPVHFIDDWQLDLQSGIGDGPNDFTEPCNDDVFVLIDNEQ